MLAAGEGEGGGLCISECRASVSLVSAAFRRAGW